MSRQNLFPRHQTWYVRVGVNPKHREIVGKSEYVRTTGTRDFRKAETLKHGIIASIHREIEEKLQQHKTDNPKSPGWVTAQARAIRKLVSDGDLDSDLASDFIWHIQDQHLSALGTDRERATDAQATYLRSASDFATNPDYKPLSEAMADYLREIEGKVVASTYQSKKRMLDEFEDWLTGDPTPAEVTRKVSGKYVSEVIVGNGKSESTNQVSPERPSWLLGLVYPQGSIRSHEPMGRPWAGH